MTELVTLTIDDRQVTVPKGTLVVDAAAQVGIEIPIFCSHPKLDPVACCRMCLVEISGPRGMTLQTACSVPVAQDMVVRTNTPQVKEVQEANLAFILLNHPLDCPICDKGGECPLQDQTMRFGPGLSQLVEPKRTKNKNYLISDTIVLDQERCILCWRCIRYLEEWEDKPQLALFERGGETLIDIQDGKPVDAKTSGNIIDICPVGALTNRVARFAFRPWEIERTPSICTQCSMGCNLRIDTRTHTLRRVIGRENMQVNDQWICDKGRFANAWVNHEQRLTTPLVRKNGELQPASWHEALSLVADRLQAIKQRHGADAIGAIGSAKLSNESNYLLQRFMRQLIGTNNIDHRDGGDVAALPAGMPALVNVMKPQYGPDPKHDVIMLVGFDPSEEAPVLDLHLKRAVRRGKAKLIIVHPRRIELTRYDGPFLQANPGTEVTLLNGLLRSLTEAKNDQNSEAYQLVADVQTQEVEKFCGVAADEINKAAAALAGAQNPLILYGPMVARGEAGVQVRQALINLALYLGKPENLAYVGLEANSQGCRDVGLLPDRLPGHAELADPMANERLSQLWGCTLPTRPGKTYRQMLDAAGGEIKALYIMGANPASERPTWAENLDKLDFLVVQELFLTETAARANVVLPAVSWAEQDGTFTNLERRVQRAPKALSNPRSKAAPDWMILDHLATYFDAQWSHANAQAVTTEITQAAPIYTGLTWEALGDQGLQWSATDHPYARVEMHYASALQPKLPQSNGSLRLVSGTVLYDGGDLFRLTQHMKNMAFAAEVRLNPVDGETLGVAEGETVTVRNDHGVLELTVKFDVTVKPGTAWIPESLPGAPVGALLNGSIVANVFIAK
ncbi:MULTISPECIES: NADH-quinone oxidoreductase subunit NuoG [Caldilinea]|jgi:NADH-quinone oxidoreductase subunit G|uniref:NADH-quinone oxidoreductase n=1 Tax=Caldilinea aerophila (strain DSM 14535 / JCM 11387 / NBRC 104270 / STL-6-O1) TaxID=926550 RepID=I0I0X4_CALAS|nr:MULTISPECIES: NADH-quinone oxidoreductase subunit NuoG [Caldilinea]MBO9391540.1 NADH-quinone oxidoreductase subunit NuoG [Caldilinea sp.]BAL98911.1 putative formate dehydrogenase alpha subunit [Caldilinea aerophila DSM 14535 = NBRC 104270]GIV74503.1 MAG: NADH-quinone oxidoreductase [Caldilinea sp.]